MVVLKVGKLILGCSVILAGGIFSTRSVTADQTSSADQVVNRVQSVKVVDEQSSQKRPIIVQSTSKVIKASQTNSAQTTSSKGVVKEVSSTPVNSKPVKSVSTYRVVKSKSLAKRVYQTKNTNGYLYNLQTLKHGKVSLNPNVKLNTVNNANWVVSGQKTFQTTNKVRSLYYQVKEEKRNLNGWIWHSNLSLKKVNLLGNIKNTKSIRLFRKSTSGAMYKFNGPTYDASYSKAQHYLKNYTDTVWTSTKTRTLTDKSGKKYNYLYITNGKKASGWINSIYLSNRVLLKVKPICQNPKFPTGCEAVATTMMLQHAGVKVSADKVVDSMPRAKTGDKGFVGNPRSNTGLWIFPPAMVKVARKFVKTAVNMTGSSFNQIQKKLNRGHAVVAWITGFGGNGTRFNHAITLIGYDLKKVFFNDPWTGKQSSMSIGTLANYRKRDLYRTISY